MSDGGGAAAGGRHRSAAPPGRAFGTGTHASTALYLAWLADADLGGARVLDYGCGSGILAIAALLLGAERAWACDVDGVALAVMSANAAANGVAPQLWCGDPGALPDGAYDIIVANILAATLVDLAPRLARLQCGGGGAVLAGILSDQTPVVAAAYASWYDLEAPAERDGWALVHGRRRAVTP